MVGGIKDSRVSQEEEVEHRVVLAEVDQRPAEHPAAERQQAEPRCDQNHVAEKGSAAALRHLHRTPPQVTRETAGGFHSHRGYVYLMLLLIVCCVFTSETIVQTSLLANMTVIKIARW